MTHDDKIVCISVSFLTISFPSVASYDFLNNWYTFMMSIVHVLKKDFSLWIYHCS